MTRLFSETSTQVVSSHPVMTFLPTVENLTSEVDTYQKLTNDIKTLRTPCDFITVEQILSGYKDMDEVLAVYASHPVTSHTQEVILPILIKVSKLLLRHARVHSKLARRSFNRSKWMKPLVYGVGGELSFEIAFSMLSNSQTDIQGGVSNSFRSNTIRRIRNGLPAKVEFGYKEGDWVTNRGELSAQVVLNQIIIHKLTIKLVDVLLSTAVNAITNDTNRNTWFSSLSKTGVSGLPDDVYATNIMHGGKYVMVYPTGGNSHVETVVVSEREPIVTTLLPTINEMDKIFSLSNELFKTLGDFTLNGNKAFDKLEVIAERQAAQTDDIKKIADIRLIVDTCMELSATIISTTNALLTDVSNYMLASVKYIKSQDTTGV